jgi:ATP-dependent DNA helicase DinG
MEEAIVPYLPLPQFEDDEKSILDYWPMKNSKPRKSQEIIFDWISKLPADKKYILLEMPVGAGKSPSAITFSGYVARSFGNSFVLTPQKILQRQYEESFERHLIGTVYGKSNYECASKNTNCDIGGDIKPECSGCPAKEAMGAAIQSPNMVLNYTLALLLFKFIDKKKLKPRKLMIFDECHTLENHLTEFNAVSISELRCKKLDLKFRVPKNIDLAMEWIQTEYFPKVARKLQEYSDIVDGINDELEFSPRKLTGDERQSFKNYKDMKEHADSVGMLYSMSLEELKERFVLVQEKQSFKFKELYGKNVFHQLVKPMADKFLFMSSTILNKDAYCRDLGINPEEAAFISVPSEFPVENRPVLYMPQFKMNYEWSNDSNYQNRKDMIMKIKDVCDLHKTDSGIIHTGSFQVAEWLVEELSGLLDHQIMHHNPSAKLGINRDTVIANYLSVSETQPTILISPSITEGLDLKNDLARFAIFMKVPYPYLGDAWVKRRMELSKEWYNRQAMIAIIQGAGRIVRSNEDWGYTYILDASFNYLYYNMQRSIPEWWKDGFQTV